MPQDASITPWSPPAARRRAAYNRDPIISIFDIGFATG
jgi:hypothetical protein